MGKYISKLFGRPTNKVDDLETEDLETEDVSFREPGCFRNTDRCGRFAENGPTGTPDGNPCRFVGPPDCSRSGCCDDVAADLRIVKDSGSCIEAGVLSEVFGFSGRAVRKAHAE